MIKIKSKAREASDLGIPYSAYKIAYDRGWKDCEEWEDYVKENNVLIDNLKPLTEDELDDMCANFEAVKKQKKLLKKEWQL